jgi:hypothetical protein
MAVVVRQLFPWGIFVGTLFVDGLDHIRILRWLTTIPDT